MALAALIVSIAAAVFAGAAGFFSYRQTRIASDARHAEFEAAFRIKWRLSRLRSTNLPQTPAMNRTELEITNAGHGKAFGVVMHFKRRPISLGDVLGDSGPKRLEVLPLPESGQKVILRWENARGKRMKQTLKLPEPPVDDLPDDL